ncbi:U-box domain-containing protein 35-like isoform X2 [Nymphaea colorata]|uniref:U-box domain-containing protein 35-like isoform X2 n=1 Tax=Nymphaea colorata TaxID=210225 RepID=UPI00129D326A|nr:U-box domain-containing protein 35-like isoform X2 [Nymphaea colorata]
MWTSKQVEKKGEGGAAVALAVDKDKGSQVALKWAVDNLLGKGQTLILIHVKEKLQSVPQNASEEEAKAYKQQVENEVKEVLLPFRCLCMRKDISCHEVVIEDSDVAKAIIEYITNYAIAVLVLSASPKTGFFRFKSTDVPTTVYKGAPDFCTVYIISKGKVSSVRQATRSVPAVVRQTTNLLTIQKLEPVKNPPPAPISKVTVDNDEVDATMKSPLPRGGAGLGLRHVSERSLTDVDSSFTPSSQDGADRMFPSPNDSFASATPSRLSYTRSADEESTSFEQRISFESPFRLLRKFPEQNSIDMDYSSLSRASGSSWSSQTAEEVEAEMRRLKLELKQTMDMYSNACKEAISAKQKAQELHRWKMEGEHKLDAARIAGETALAIAENEKAKCKAAIEAAEAAQRIAELEAQKRLNAEKKALREAEEKKKALDALANTDIRYRKYTIEEIEIATENFSEKRKIGEGGYGPVYKGYLDHTSVAIKVLRPDAAQGRMQFQQEVEVLSCIRHPNMVLLLGACPEYGCLVYEYMSNGSLEDRLLRRGNSPSLSWQLRFRIAAEIATGLLFLHQTKPEPLVHRDLKPANILLDRNFVSKISDVGLARLVPPSVADHVTQYRMTSAAGTFCYIDPEYQQTGMLGIKSDIYSLGIMLLQIVTGKPAMGLAHHVERALDKGTFKEMLDPTVPDWPVEEAITFAKLALNCAELRRKDRPDLGSVVLPELKKLAAMGEKSMMPYMFVGSATPSPNHSIISSRQEVISETQMSSGYSNNGSLRSQGSSISSLSERRVG